ncbi:MAG: hypothetical protein OXG88_11195 [Gammaproteobacteria bacterium]|nr:hypothetical protein [Gammaproteobacteria bacterium]
MSELLKTLVSINLSFLIVGRLFAEEDVLDSEPIEKLTIHYLFDQYLD